MTFVTDRGFVHVLMISKNSCLLALSWSPGDDTNNFNVINISFYGTGYGSRHALTDFGNDSA